MEPICALDVHVGPAMQAGDQQEIMMMQQPAQADPSKPIPQHVVDRMESEWKQIRENPARQPAQR